MSRGALDARFVPSEGDYGSEAGAPEKKSAAPRPTQSIVSPPCQGDRWCCCGHLRNARTVYHKPTPHRSNSTCLRPSGPVSPPPLRPNKPTTVGLFGRMFPKRFSSKFAHRPLPPNPIVRGSSVKWSEKCGSLAPCKSLKNLDARYSAELAHAQLNPALQNRFPSALGCDQIGGECLSMSSVSGV